jgi:hypothetical protein
MITGPSHRLTLSFVELIHGNTIDAIYYAITEFSSL